MGIMGYDSYISYDRAPRGDLDASNEACRSTLCRTLYCNHMTQVSKSHQPRCQYMYEN